MFTVKHIDDYGNETLFSASGVRVVRMDNSSTEQPGVVVEGVIGPDLDSIHYSFRDPGEPRANTGFTAGIFVMNEHGATVANYRL